MVTLPKLAYISLWFPKPSETFIFREVVNLRRLGLPIEVFTLYGELRSDLSPEMRSFPGVRRLGVPGLRRFPNDVAYWWKRKPRLVAELFRTVPIRRWKSVEFGGENIYAFLCGFTLARIFEEEKFDHIHAPWAMGPATAAWIASVLSRIPFSFTARPNDIHPPDGALREKIQASTFVRVNTLADVDYVRGYADDHARKICLTYNGYPLEQFRTAPVAMAPPYRIAALGRFHPIKGFDILLKAARFLADEQVDFHLTIAGAGFGGARLRALRTILGLSRRVSFPGFITHDRVSDFLSAADVFVMPSVVHSSGEHDGIPNVIMEALLHRVPVVATAVGGIPEVIIHNETGLLVPQRDPSALAEAIGRMLKNRPEALKMAERGRELVLRQFDPAANHGRIFHLFTEAARAQF